MGDILFLAHRIPYPPDRGDKIRGFNILKYLSRKKRVHLIAFADRSEDLKRKGGLAPFTGNRSIVWRSKPQLAAGVQSLLTHRPVSLTSFQNESLQQSVDNILARHAIDTIFVFSGQMAQYLPARPRQRVIMDFVDMDSAKFEAYAQSSKGLKSWMFAREARLLQQFERQVAARADASLFVSEAEAALFRKRTGAERVYAVENGIDTEFYDPAAQFKRIDSMGPLIVFTGQMDYRPNVEGVEWFVRTVWPHIRVSHPDVRFAIVGRNPTDAVKALGKEPGVVVTGEVADVRGWLAAASVAVAPLKIARGVQNKVLEAMAMARPVVATGDAAQGIDHGGTIRVGSSVGEMAEAIDELLSDPRKAAELGASARERMQQRYSWDARLAPLDELLGLTGRSAGRSTAAA
ncbi:TIGR03087 family PEP-CTERM/XrtA system glycosyltransferase [Stakelama tenebrarum]|uniref:TIGR03087 family PEP-CTERM/XrtA system glycosyltransferase n=1 Tax=Stakelama tenebrarum TaxID=2711215 RepID=A0A6G6Y6W2_9SPHN|nr:TIGR03087 family PEP-CTERM/XrtA system glycosyltransferase [Sphingosinithalassobacter tenebrarum]QIG80684.1 TIGR03087 family PEP-CTERM/XrtA system glycosyltransferase [Sphingosinithalassobacter tenebrarum]